MDRYTEAIQRLRTLQSNAKRRGVREPMAAILSTADARGRPSVRTVLLKSVDRQGVVFYTNLHSRKATQLAANPRAALCCLWEPPNDQVVVEGRVQRVSAEEADAYWATRDRKAQLGAWASRQSRPTSGRTQLMVRVAKYARRFAGRDVPRPVYWSGFRVVPDRIEFWRRRPFRLHERKLYQQVHGRWVVRWLYP